MFQSCRTFQLVQHTICSLASRLRRPVRNVFARFNHAVGIAGLADWVGSADRGQRPRICSYISYNVCLCTYVIGARRQRKGRDVGVRWAREWRIVHWLRVCVLLMAWPSIITINIFLLIMPGLSLEPMGLLRRYTIYVRHY